MVQRVMHHMLRHTWSVSLLSALLVVGLLQAYPALPGSPSSRSSQGSDGATSLPQQDLPSGPRIAIPLSAAVPVTQSEQSLPGAPDVTAASKGHRPVACDAAFAGTLGFLAAPRSGHTSPPSRLHLFCVYRL